MELRNREIVRACLGVFFPNPRFQGDDSGRKRALFKGRKRDLSFLDSLDERLNGALTKTV